MPFNNNNLKEITIFFRTIRGSFYSIFLNVFFFVETENYDAAKRNWYIVK